MEPNKDLCEYCLKYISKNVIITHKATCRKINNKNNFEFMTKEEKENIFKKEENKVENKYKKEHINGDFKAIICPKCSDIIDSRYLSDHTKICPNKNCRYCGDSYPNDFIEDHYKFCDKKNQNYNYQSNNLNNNMNQNINTNINSNINSNIYSNINSNMNNNMNSNMNHNMNSSIFNNAFDNMDNLFNNVFNNNMSNTNNMNNMNNNFINNMETNLNSNTNHTNTNSNNSMFNNLSNQINNNTNQNIQISRNITPNGEEIIQTTITPNGVNRVVRIRNHNNNFIINSNNPFINEVNNDNFDNFLNHRNFMRFNRINLFDDDFFQNILGQFYREDRGMDSNDLNNLEEFKYTKPENVKPEEIEKCNICISEFETNDTLRKLPCSHLFHKECIDTWLVQNAVCPTCKHKLN